MFYKYVIYFGDEKKGQGVGVKYDIRKRQVKIGGAVSLKDFLPEFIETQFLVQPPLAKYPNPSKVLFTFPLCWTKWWKVRKGLEENFGMIAVKRMGRIMR